MPERRLLCDDPADPRMARRGARRVGLRMSKLNLVPSIVFLGIFTLFSCEVKSATLPAGFTEQVVGSGWNEAVGMLFEDNGRMYVWERGGRVWIVENGVKMAYPLIDISDEVGGWRDFGLLGFALDPNFRSNGYIYLLYVVDHHHLVNAGTTNYNPSVNEYFRATIGRITRYTAKAADAFKSVDYSTRRVLVGESIDKVFRFSTSPMGWDHWSLAPTGHCSPPAVTARAIRLWISEARPKRIIQRHWPRGLLNRRRTSALTARSLWIH